jgi:hypothetical protein
MPLDEFGRNVSVGDQVSLTGIVESLTDGVDFVNCAVLLDNVMPPTGAQTRISLNTAQLVLTNPTPAVLNPQSADVGPSSGAGGFSVVTNSNMSPWTASTSDSWISGITPVTPTVGDATVRFSYDAQNPGDPARTGTVDVAPLSLSFTVNQAVGTLKTVAHDKPHEKPSHEEADNEKLQHKRTLR